MDGGISGLYLCCWSAINLFIRHPEGLHFYVLAHIHEPGGQKEIGFTGCSLQSCFKGEVRLVLSFKTVADKSQAINSPPNHVKPGENPFSFFKKLSCNTPKKYML